MRKRHYEGHSKRRSHKRSKVRNLSVKHKSDLERLEEGNIGVELGKSPLVLLKSTEPINMSPLTLPESQIVATSPLNIKQTRDYLQSVCDNANFCTAFGRETNLINSYFKFPTFQYVVNTTTISKGSNGIVTELIYDRQEYRASAILKTDKTRGADNLYFEGYNGMKYINKLAKQFPCWLETYGVYKFKPAYAAELKNSLYHNDLGNPGEKLALGLEPIQTQHLDINTLSDSCFNNSNAALLIQYINQPLSFNQWINYNKSEQYCINIELPIILFQIYSVLSALSLTGAFTHYDLHGDNILLYKIPNEQYITLRYINTIIGIPIELKTQYIVKIIDYGRAFCPNNQQIYDLLCQAPLCNAPINVSNDKGDSEVINDTCGYETGYPFFSNKHDTEEDLRKQFYISCNHINTAHDLLFAKRIVEIPNIEWNSSSNWLYLILASVKLNYKDKYGTPSMPDFLYNPNVFFPVENDARGLLFPAVRTVTELYWSITNFIIFSPIFYQSMNKLDNVLNKYGEITIDLFFRGYDDIIPMHINLN